MGGHPDGRPGAISEGTQADEAQGVVCSRPDSLPSREVLGHSVPGSAHGGYNEAPRPHLMGTSGAQQGSLKTKGRACPTQMRNSHRRAKKGHAFVKEEYLFYLPPRARLGVQGQCAASSQEKGRQDCEVKAGLGETLTPGRGLRVRDMPHPPGSLTEGG